MNNAEPTRHRPRNSAAANQPKAFLGPGGHSQHGADAQLGQYGRKAHKDMIRKTYVHRKFRFRVATPLPYQKLPQANHHPTEDTVNILPSNLFYSTHLQGSELRVRARSNHFHHPLPLPRLALTLPLHQPMEGVELEDASQPEGVQTQNEEGVHAL